MAKKLIPLLKEGHTIIGKVKSKESEALIMVDGKGNEFRLPMLNAFIQALEICESANPILEIKRQNGDYIIYEHEVWPDEIAE